MNPQQKIEEIFSEMESAMNELNPEKQDDPDVILAQGLKDVKPLLSEREEEAFFRGYNKAYPVDLKWSEAEQKEMKKAFQDYKNSEDETR